MTTNNAVDVGLAGATGTGNFVGSNNPSILNPRISTVIDDSNGNIILGLNPTASSVNYLQLQNAATTSAPALIAIGSDTNIIMTLAGQGTGRAQIKGTGTNNNVSLGYVGEFMSVTLAFASATSLTNITPKDVLTLSLTAGDWDVWGNIFFNFAGGVGATNALCWTSLTSATMPDNSLLSSLAITGMAGGGFNVPKARYILNGTTTVYLSCEAAFASGTGTACGGLYARRRS